MNVSVRFVCYQWRYFYFSFVSVSNNNHLYSLHKRHIKHNVKKYECVYTVHKITHLVKKTQKMLHKKVCIDYCKILENVKVFTSCKN